MDITKLCRSCMREVASWEKENFNDSAVEMFCFCTNIKVNLIQLLSIAFKSTNSVFVCNSKCK